MMDRAAFDERYRREGDPWGYHDSPYERTKYAATLAACGPGRFRRTLELGASIGVFSALLAPRCDHLITVDFSAVAVASARARLEHHDHVDVRVAEIPAELPDGCFDLVVASEVLYYLEPGALAATLEWLRTGLDPDGRLVLVHWRPGGPERPFSAQQVHDRLRSQPWLRSLRSSSTEDYLLDVLEPVARI